MELLFKDFEIWCRFKSPLGWQERFVCRQSEYDGFSDEAKRNVWFLDKLDQIEHERVEASLPDQLEWLEQWLEFVKAHKSAQTYESYELSARLFEKYCSQVEMAYWSDHFSAELKKAQTSANTAHKHCNQISIGINWAKKRHLLPVDLFFEVPARKKKIQASLSWEEVLKIEEYFLIQNKPCHRAWKMMRHTAMRISEVSNLLLERIDLQKRVILIQDLEETGFAVKGGHEESIPISKGLYEFLESDLRKRNKQEKFYIDDGFGKRLWSQNPKVFGRHLRKLGYRGVKPTHCVRAAVLTRLASCGFNQFQIQKLARHRSLETTRGYVNQGAIGLSELVEGL